MEALDFCVRETEAVLEEHEDPCILNTSEVPLNGLVDDGELVMHPCCLHTFTVCLDPDTEPVTGELLSSPVLPKIVPGKRESVQIPVVLQPLTHSFPDLGPQFLGKKESTREPIPENRGELPATPTQENGMQEEEEKLSEKEPSCTISEATSPLETATAGVLNPNSSSWHSTEAPLTGSRSTPPDPPVKAAAATTTTQSQKTTRKRHPTKSDSDKPCFLCGKASHWVRQRPIKNDFIEFQDKEKGGKEGEERVSDDSPNLSDFHTQIHVASWKKRKKKD